MAKWALWVVIVSVATLGVTAVGIYYVRQTLREAGETTKAAIRGAEAADQSVEEARKTTKLAQETADVSREAMLATDRAWLKIEVAPTTDMVFSAETVTIGFRFTVFNVGRSPATHVGWVADLCPDIINAGYKVDELARNKILSILGAGNYGRTLFPGDGRFTEEWVLELPIEQFRNAILESHRIGQESKEPYPVTKSAPAIVAGVRYVLPGDRKFRFTYIPFEIRRREGGHEGWDGSSCVVPCDQITLREGFMTGRIS